jgi:pyrroloquinoline quinone biosynthesis protein B
LRIRVLGSAAGGGFPQWNCACENCSGLRANSIHARARTQESVAISADDRHWFLLNASPEIRAQIESFAGLHPRAPRHSPIAALLLTNGDLDHALGLFCLRESQPLQVYATERVREGLTQGNTLYRTLERFPGQVTWHRLRIGESCELPLPDRGSSGLTLEALAVPGQPPLHLRARYSADAEDNVGFRIRDVGTGGTLLYLSGAAAVTEVMRRELAQASCVFFDGTFWSSDELITRGLGEKRAEDMAHLPVGGPNGSLAVLQGVRASAKLFIHINNTNPMLREDSIEHAAVVAAGWRVAHDGLELTV